MHTFLNHSDGQTLLEATKLTSVSSPFVDRTVLIAETDIFGALLDRPLEESLTS